MAGVDINSFDDRDKTDAHPDETGKAILLTQGWVMEGSS